MATDIFEYKSHWCEESKTIPILDLHPFSTIPSVLMEGEELFERPEYHPVSPSYHPEPRNHLLRIKYVRCYSPSKLLVCNAVRSRSTPSCNTTELLLQRPTSTQGRVVAICWEQTTWHQVPSWQQPAILCSRRQRNIYPYIFELGELHDNGG